MTMTNHDTMTISEKSKDTSPNFARRRGAAAIMATLTLLGAWKATELVANGVSEVSTSISQTEFDKLHCAVDGTTEVVGNNETVWDAAAAPLAHKLDIPVDAAMDILGTANPSITSLGKVAAGTVISIPTCK
jgi:hypothetical protein